MEETVKYKKRKLNLMITLGIGFVLVPLVMFLIFNNVFGMRQINNQVLKSNQDVLKIVTGSIEEKLDNIEQQMANNVVFSDYLYVVEQQILSGDDENIRNNIYSVRQLYKELKSVREFNPILAGIAAYSEDGDLIVGDFGGTSRPEMEENIRQIMGGDKALILEYQKSWIAVVCGDKNYLLTVKSMESRHVICWILADTLLNQAMDQEFSLIDKIYIKSGEKLLAGYNYVNQERIQKEPLGKDEVTTSYPFCSGRYTMNADMDQKNILAGMDRLQVIIFAIAILTVLIIPAAYCLIRRIVLLPVRQLSEAMVDFKEGNLERQIEAEFSVEEFGLLGQTFNEMTDEIRKLKIDVYEKKIRNQQVELQYLRLQIKPHFLLNTLNVIYSFLLTKSVEGAKDITRSLIKYLRVILRDDRQSMTVSEETEHLENYLHIMEMRYAHPISYYIDVQEEAAVCKIPPLILQTFVENSIKHSGIVDNGVEIAVDIWLETEANMLCISIIDTGNGLDEKALETINMDSVKSPKGHIGIWNVKQRLRIMYGGRASVSISNRLEGGVRVDIRIPVIEEWGGDDVSRIDC